MTVELICVGTELLLGNIVNTNAAFLADNNLKGSLKFAPVVGGNHYALIRGNQPEAADDKFTADNQDYNQRSAGEN